MTSGEVGKQHTHVGCMFIKKASENKRCPYEEIQERFLMVVQPRACPPKSVIQTTINIYIYMSILNLYLYIFI